MGFFDRMARGWEISMSSLKVLNANKQLIIFPLLSALSLCLIAGSFIYALIADSAFSFIDFAHISTGVFYIIMFAFYIVNYFIIVFFNMALMHCARLYFQGQEVSVSQGLQFSVSRLGRIFSWALFAATVGILLKIVQDNLGWLGKIITGLVGFVWSLSIFFVIPILAYEDLGPTEAVARSAQMMKDKWGESLGATFSFGIINLIGFALFGVLGISVSSLINETAGILLFAGGAVMTILITNTMNSIFISAVYNNINGNINAYYNQQMLDGLFESKD